MQICKSSRNQWTWNNNEGPFTALYAFLQFSGSISLPILTVLQLQQCIWLSVQFTFSQCVVPRILEPPSVLESKSLLERDCERQVDVISCSPTRDCMHSGENKYCVASIFCCVFFCLFVSNCFGMFLPKYVHKMAFFRGNLCLWPYHTEYTSSHLITEVKQCRTCSCWNLAL